jgi:dolichol-phosphate mannosyltransferase
MPDFTAGDRDSAAAGPPGLSVVVPCYNEEDCLIELHRRVSTVCRGAVGDSAYELIFVNDGSRDATWPLMVRLAHDDPHVIAVGLSRNHGHELALSAGLSLARGERVFVLDADLQDPPELLPEMMRLMDAGADVVYGQRSDRKGETRFKRATARGFYRLLDWLVDVDIPLDTGNFRLMSRRVLDVLNGMPEHNRFFRGMVGWIGFRQVAMPYERDARFSGETKYSFSRMRRVALDAITSFSTRPLEMASLLGIMFAGVAALGTLYAIANWTFGSVIPGWTSVILVLLVVSSVQLLMFGVIGEYLGRLYMESKRRPLFLIDRVVGPGPATPNAAIKPLRRPADAADAFIRTAVTRSPATLRNDED